MFLGDYGVTDVRDSSSAMGPWASQSPQSLRAEQPQLPSWCHLYLWPAQQPSWGPIQLMVQVAGEAGDIVSPSGRNV